MKNRVISPLSRPAQPKGKKKIIYGIIILAIMYETIDNEKVRNCFGISRDKASTLIKAMVAEQIIQISGPSKKYAKYVLTKMYRQKIFS